MIGAIATFSPLIVAAVINRWPRLNRAYHRVYG